MIMDLFNHATSSVTLMTEGIKLLMFIRVVELYQLYVSGEDVPMHAWMLFARESSSNPRLYYKNHMEQPTAHELDQVNLYRFLQTHRNHASIST